MTHLVSFADALLPLKAAAFVGSFVLILAGALPLLAVGAAIVA